MMKAIPKAQKEGKAPVGGLCRSFGVTRDAYYKFSRRQKARHCESARVVEMVKEERKEQPRVGARRLHKALYFEFKANGMKVGRDRLFNILRHYGMLVKRKKASCRTTDSRHHFHKYGNLIKGMEITAPNQVWVSDITYIRTIKGFCYLALITDVCSRKIVGYDISDSLELAGCLRALKKALRQARPAAGLVHHSDRGAQYCSHQYTAELKKWKIKISMTEENHCYENAIAERVNGILKDEFYLDQCFYNTLCASKAAKNAIEIYNSKRLHLSLGYKTPNMVFKNVVQNNVNL
jgi:putative transposase